MAASPYPENGSLSFLGLLRRDFARYVPYGTRVSFARTLYTWIDTPGLHAILTYRFGNWVSRRVRLRIVRYPLLVLHYLLDKLCIVLWGIHVNRGARIGPGLYIGHYGGVIIGPVEIGEDCNVAHQVTVGLRVDGQPGLPRFGNNVWIGTGAVIYGDITIGNGVMIAPCTVVARSLPDRCMVLGNPLRVLSSDYDNYVAIYGRPRPEASVSAAAT